MSGSAPAAQRLAALVDEAFRTLPERYLGAEAGFDATYHVRLGDIGRTWEVRATTHGARVRRGASRRTPDVTIGTNATTWLRLREGELSGLEAFMERSLYARGNLDLAIGFEGMSSAFPTGARPSPASTTSGVGRHRILDAEHGRGTARGCSSTAWAAR